MSAGLVTVADLARITAGANTSVKPILLARTGGAPAGGGDGSERISAGRPAILEIGRARDGATGALDGTVGIWGANLPHPDGASSSVNVFRGDGAAVNCDFPASFIFAAFANYNWVVIQDGVVLEQGAGAGKYTITNPASTTARIVLGTAAPLGSKIEGYLVTPVAVRSVAANEIERTQVIATNLVWLSYVVASTNLSRTIATLKPAGA